MRWRDQGDRVTPIELICRTYHTDVALNRSPDFSFKNEKAPAEGPGLVAHPPEIVDGNKHWPPKASHVSLLTSMFLEEPVTRSISRGPVELQDRLAVRRNHLAVIASATEELSRVAKSARDTEQQPLRPA